LTCKTENILAKVAAPALRGSDKISSKDNVMMHQ